MLRNPVFWKAFAVFGMLQVLMGAYDIAVEVLRGAGWQDRITPAFLYPPFGLFFLELARLRIALLSGEPRSIKVHYLAALPIGALLAIGYVLLSQLAPGEVR